MPRYENEHEEAVVTESRHKLKRPPLYKVLIHNDNFTTMDFVVFVLTTIFQHSETEATLIMLQVHLQGVGVAGVYTHEIAETKVEKVTALAQSYEYPLLCTMEETDEQG
ncbi:MAG TPA: ATP-dependent Clp protease adapter ClpS [Pyrinomonadaceae bacterium]|jgi:ATP-dependent Clp protease adaptor protein ClpS|nr:ATP-dependent Clp protease adapter ClpS [Pyrinomonadaceae bacterium]